MLEVVDQLPAQPTNQRTLCFSEGGASLRPGLNRDFLMDWEERCSNNVKYLKNNVFFFNINIMLSIMF